MIALKNTTNDQIFYIIHKRIEGDTHIYGLTSLDVEYTENGQYSINPPSGYDGLSSVNVTVDVDKECNLTTSTVTLTGDGEYSILPPEGYDGFTEVVVNVENECDDRYDEGYDDGITDQKAKLASTTFTQNGSYTREDGWNAVQVSVDTVTPYNNGKQDGIDEQKAKLISGTFTQNGTYNREDGYNQVIVDVDTVTPYNNGVADQKAKLTDITIVSNGRYTREDGYDDITVNVPSDINNQSKQVTYTQNGTQTVIADNGYSGLSQVAVTVNVDTQTPYNNGKQDGIDEQKAKIESITITNNGTYTKADGYSPVVVNVQPNLTTDTFTSNGTYTPTGYDGYSSVTVNVDTQTPYDNGYSDGEDAQKAKLITGTFTQNGTYTRADGYDEVIVNVPSDVHNQNKQTTITQNGTQTISADSGYTGLGSVEVTVDVDTQTPYDNGYADGEADQKAKLSTLTVTQNGTYTAADGYGTVIVDVQCGGTKLYADPTLIETDLNGGTTTVNIFSDLNWSTANVPNWITLSQSTGNSGITSITVTVSSSANDRSGSFVITDGTNSVTITVIQATDYSRQYLTFEHNGSTGYSDVYWMASSSDVAGTQIQYSTDNGSTWTTVASSVTKTTSNRIRISANSKVLVKGNMNGVWNNTSGNGNQFGESSSTNTFKVYGNIMSLLNGDNFVGTQLTSSNQYAFKRLFYYCGGLKDASNLILPNNTQKYCYESMFEQCNGCSDSVFSAPPALPATTLSEGCYKRMFACTRVTSSSISLPATTLASHCYEGMFYYCLNMQAVTLPATTLQPYCYKNMFYGCSAMRTAPNLPALTLVAHCYENMFNSCSNLNSVKCLATNTSATDCTKYWLSYVSTSGTFTKASSKTWASGASGIPQYWVIQNA